MEAEMAGARRVAIDDVKAIVSFMIEWCFELCGCFAWSCAASKSACVVPRKPASHSVCVVSYLSLQPHSSPFVNQFISPTKSEEISTLFRVMMRRLLGLHAQF